MFPRLRWAAVGWLVVWTPSYAAVWGWRNFLQLCDVAVFLSAAGIWRGSPLLLSSQALSSLVVDGLWSLDVAWRLATGRHIVGGTEYMWDASRPLAVRLLSLFHFFLPPLLLGCLRERRVGYDRRGLHLQIGIAAATLAVSRFVGDEVTNPNFAFRDPFYRRPLGPPLAHLAITLGALVAAVYVPTHLVLGRVLPRARS